MSDRLETVKRWITGAGAASEDESDRDGVLSYAKEWHALMIGLGAGVAGGVPGVAVVAGTALGVNRWGKISNRKALVHLKREPWYGIAGSLIGWGITNLDVVQASIPLV